MHDLSTLSLGFRERYLGYDELTRQLRAWAEAFPSVVRVESLAKTREGRDVWLATIGRDPDRPRPAAWVDANMHASEVAGSSVALAIAEDLVRMHLSDAPVHDLPPHLAAILRDDVLVHVLPRLCPDGAERVLTSGAYVRSNPRDDRPARSMPYWRSADVDGDGRVRLLRREDPAGDFVRAPERPDLLVRRRLEDPGPYYALYPEGFVENWDGCTVPCPVDFLSDNAVDMNRNFPFGWAPEPRQKGAGAFAASEPESRAVATFAARHPNLFGWLNLHTFGGCYIRPCGDRIDKKMDPSDLRLFHQIGEWTEAIAGYPMVSGFEEFVYEPDVPLCGDLAAFAYGQLGCVAMACELWDFWAQAGLTVRRPFVDNYDRRSRADVVAIAKWDAEHNKGRVVGGWKPFDHPQLGRVEIGGFDPFVGIWNPPPERLAEICTNQSRVFLRIAALAPRVRTAAHVERLEGEVSRLVVDVANEGYLPTWILDSAKSAPHAEPLRAEVRFGDGVRLAAGEPRLDVGHLDGWGDHDNCVTPAFARTTSDAVRKRVAWLVRGKGRVTIAVIGARVGRVETTVEVG